MSTIQTERLMFKKGNAVDDKTAGYQQLPASVRYYILSSIEKET